MDLPEELEKQFQIELKAFEEARQMKYVSTIERWAKRDERLATQTEIAINFLKEDIPIETIARATGLTIEQIQELQAQTT
jgi:hypothetical protein